MRTKVDEVRDELMQFFRSCDHYRDRLNTGGFAKAATKLAAIKLQTQEDVLDVLSATNVASTAAHTAIQGADIENLDDAAGFVESGKSQLVVVTQQAHQSAQGAAKSVTLLGSLGRQARDLAEPLQETAPLFSAIQTCCAVASELLDQVSDVAGDVSHSQFSASRPLSDRFGNSRDDVLIEGLLSRVRTKARDIEASRRRSSNSLTPSSSQQQEFQLEALYSSHRITAGGRKLPMNTTTIEQTAKRYEIELKGVRIEIRKSAVGYRGVTNSRGQIVLARDAFANEEELARTLYHEMVHVRQIKQNSGRYPTDPKVILQWEKEAHAKEDAWWESHPLNRPEGQ